jgi:hypothetical protein
VTLVQYIGELDFGQALEPAKSFPTLAAFEPVWRDSSQKLAVVEWVTYREMLSEGFPMIVRASASHDLIVSRR